MNVQRDCRKELHMERLPEIDMEKTGRNIARLRKERGFTVKDVAARLMLASAQTVYQWESGQTLPTVDNLVLLALIFDVSVDELLVRRFHE